MGISLWHLCLFIIFRDLRQAVIALAYLLWQNFYIRETIVGLCKVLEWFIFPLSSQSRDFLIESLISYFWWKEVKNFKAEISNKWWLGLHVQNLETIFQGISCKICLKCYNQHDFLIMVYSISTHFKLLPHTKTLILQLIKM